MIIPVTETVIGVQVIGHNSDTIIKSPIVKARISNSLQDSSTVASDSPVDVETRVEQLEAVKHTHANKDVLDRLSDADGKLQFDGKEISGGGASTAEEVSYTNADLPNASNVKGALDAIAKTQQQHEDDINALGDAFTELDKKSHTHANKDILDGITADKTAEWDGKSDFSGSYNDLTDKPTALKNPYALTVNVDGVNTNYDGSAEKMVAVKGATKQVTAGSNITLEDNTEYRLTNVTTLNLTYPTDNFECWMRLSFATNGDATVTLPVDTKYLGAIPNFKNGETWELGFKDKVLAAQKVGDGT